MPTEDAVELVETEATEVTKPDEATISDARRQGWKPKADYSGDPDQWVDADEFLRLGTMERKEMLRELRGQKSTISELRESIRDVMKMVEKSHKAGYDKRQAELDALRDQAIEVGDKAAVKVLDKEIDALKAEATEAKAERKAEGPPPEVAQFIKDNAWFTKDQEMADFAISFQATRIKRNPDEPMADNLKAVLAAVKRAFPDKFENPRRNEAGAVEGAPRVGTAKGFRESDLSPEQKTVWGKLKKQNVMEFTEYVKGLREAGEIK